MKKVNNGMNAKEKLDIEINRIKKSRQQLEDILDDLNRRIRRESQGSNIQTVGFNIDDIEKNMNNEVMNELIKKRNAIEKALKQDNYCDLEFCKAAKEYTDSIREQINEYDEKIEENNLNVEKAKEYLEKMKEKKEKENYNFMIMMDKLLNPLNATVFSEYACKSGTGTLNSVEIKLNQILNLGE